MHCSINYARRIVFLIYISLFPPLSGDVQVICTKKKAQSIIPVHGVNLIQQRTHDTNIHLNKRLVINIMFSSSIYNNDIENLSTNIVLP